MLNTLKRVGRVFKEHHAESKAELEGKARSKARLLLPARFIPELRKFLGTINGQKHRGPARPILGAGIKMHDGRIMIYHSDGSLRSALGPKDRTISGRQRRIRRKTARRVARERA